MLVSQFPPKNTYHMHTGIFSCDYCLCDIQKYLTASLSWWLVRRAILLVYFEGLLFKTPLKFKDEYSVMTAEMTPA